MSVDSSDCQNPSPHPATILSYPWKGEEYDDDKSKFFKFVRNNRYNGRPTRLIDAVKHVYGGDYGEAERRRLSRLANRCDWFSTNSAPGYVEVEPTPECFKVGGLSYADNQILKQTEGDGIDFDTSQTGTVQYPKDRAESILDKRVRLDGGQYKDKHDYRSEIFRELAQYREDIGDKYSIFKQRLREKYLLQPCLNRFNDTGRATKSKQLTETALQDASEDYNQGAVLTVTVDPNRFESHTEATEALSDNVQNLMKTLEYRLGDDWEADNLKILEFQGNGLPHYHIVLFGVRVLEGETETGEATVSTEELREYWDTKRDMGTQVDVSPVYCRGDTWILHEDSDCTVSLSYYLTKEIRDLITVAETDTEELFDMVEAGDIALWRQALYWIYGKQYASCSQSLKGDEEGGGDDLPNVVIWEYVGTAKYEQIPSQIIDNAVLCRSQPPP